MTSATEVAVSVSLSLSMKMLVYDMVPPRYCVASRNQWFRPDMTEKAVGRKPIAKSK